MRPSNGSSSALVTVALGIVLLAVISVGPDLLAVMSVGSDTPVSTDTVAVTQAGECQTVSTLGDGSRTVSEYYDYRARTGPHSGEPGRYSSYGTTDIQESQVSQLFAYRGSKGVSLVMLHDELGDERGNGALQFNITGLPEDREWVVEDDQYPGRDDVFDHGTTESTIKWKWRANRTEGAVVRGLASDQYEQVTIDPLFNAGDSYWNWPWADDDIDRWILRSGDGTTYRLNMSRNVSVRAGYCAGSSPAANRTTVDSAPVSESVTVSANESTDDGRIVEHRRDRTGDGE